MTREHADELARRWIAENRTRIITPAAKASLAALLQAVAMEARANEAQAERARGAQ